MMIDAWFPFVGGGQMHVKSLIKHLKAHRAHVSLFHSPHHHIVARLLWNLWVIPQIIIAHQKQHFDIIHAHAFSAGIPGKIISSILKIPIVYTVHGSHLMDTRAKGLKAWGERFLLTKIRYNHQISVTRSFTKYSNVNKNISVIRNGVDIKAFNNVKVKKNKNFTLLYVGRDHPTKGIHYLRQAFKKVKKKHSEIKLTLITSGKKTGRSLVREYKKAHLFILPSLAEGQPLVLLEAWAAKLPVIATKTTGVLEVAKNNQDTILVAPGDVSQLATAINKVLNMSFSQRGQLVKNGFRKAKRDFGWSHIANQTFIVYQKLLKQSST